MVPCARGSNSEIRLLIASKASCFFDQQTTSRTEYNLCSYFLLASCYPIFHLNRSHIHIVSSLALALAVCLFCPRAFPIECVCRRPTRNNSSHNPTKSYAINFPHALSRSLCVFDGPFIFSRFSSFFLTENSSSSFLCFFRSFLSRVS